MKYKLRESINTYTDILESYFFQSFLNKTDHITQSIGPENDKIIPKINSEIEIQRFNEIKGLITDTLSKHQECKSQYLLRQYERNYKKKLNELYYNFYGPKNQKSINSLEGNKNNVEFNENGDDLTTRESIIFSSILF